jgi:subtilisin family serine protease
VPSLQNDQVTVMLQLRGAPVTVVEAAHGGHLSKSRQQAIRGSLRALQAPVAREARSLGGKVEHSFQLVYNGIQVRVAANRIPALQRIPGVIAVRVLHPMKPDNTHGVPLVGGPAVWGGVPGYAGEGIKLAIIDTGIDYTHADFGGPGTPAAYTDAHAHEADPANPAYFGPAAPRVKGGVDLVGDAYDGGNTPVPDTNPLDCGGHGTHVAGSAGGSGVLSNGSTFTGPYNATTVSSNSWLVGPGVAPKADLYAIRVFGCGGSTNETVAAIEWAVDHDMDVVNMSLGSPYGDKHEPSAEASTNAAAAGVLIVTSAGNSGQRNYLTGSPGTSTGVLSTAASDPLPSFPGATITLSTGPVISAIVANGAPLPGGPLQVKVLLDGGGNISLGCNPAEYVSAGVTGKLVITRRGTCARVARAIYGQQAGAAAVLMVNNVDSLPPYEGEITSNPDTGQPFTVTIPFLGVKSSDGPALKAADGGTATFAGTTVPNPTYLALGSFSSGGPRTGDSWLKPDITGPGVGIFSAAVGTGNQAVNLSGTSMASPHAAGVAALVRQAHPTWTNAAQLRAAIENTADASLVQSYNPRTAGAGLVQAPPAVKTEVVALGWRKSAALSFGFRELLNTMHTTRDITLVNNGAAPATFTIGTSHLSAGTPFTVTVGPNVTVPAHDKKVVPVQLNVPATTAGNADDFHDVSGLVTFTPAAGDNHDVALAVPFYLVETGASKLHTSVVRNSPTQATATTTNNGGAITGIADWYAWGISDPKDDGGDGADLRAVGVQTFPNGAEDVIVFAVSSWSRWSNPASVTPEIFVDVDSNGTDDYVVYSQDEGVAGGGGPNGRAETIVVDLASGFGFPTFFTTAANDSRIMLLPFLVDDLCFPPTPCLASNARFKYRAEFFGRNGEHDVAAGPGAFNWQNPAISTAAFYSVAPGGSVPQDLTIDPAEQLLTPFLGAMVVTADNKVGSEAQLITIPSPPAP